MSESRRPLRLLITSVGSLVGQNLLEGLAGRRALCDIVGLNSQPDAVSNFLCDRVYRVPELGDAEAFEARFGALMAQEAPDLVLPGRDDDVVFLAAWGAHHGDLAERLMVGSERSARRLRDKRLTADLAAAHGLPFAPTLSLEDGWPAVRALQAAWGWPLVAKPRLGNASRGVMLVCDGQQLETVLGWPDYCVQPWLGEPVDVAAFRRLLQGGVPLDWSLPGIEKLSLDGCVLPSGELVALFATQHAQVRLGRSEQVRRLPLEAPLLGLLQDFGQALAREGWRGPFNVQMGRLPDGRLLAFEINGRFTGSAATLALLGLDYIGACVAAFVSRPEFELPSPAAVSRVDKRLTNWPLPEQAVQTLAQQGRWPAP